MASIKKKTIIRYTLDGKRVPKDTPGAIKTRHESKNWYGKYRDANNQLREASLCSDKTMANRQLADILRLVEREKIGDVQPEDNHRLAPLAEHLADYQQHLLAKGDGVKHVAKTINRIKSILAGCEFDRLADISASKVYGWLHNQRQQDGQQQDGAANGHKTIRFGVKTSNHYLRAIKGFLNWLVEDGRHNSNPLTKLKPLNADVDVRHDRRVLSSQDFNLLLDTTKQSSRTDKGKGWAFDGLARWRLYTIAAYTGLRASECASLTGGSFDWDAETITVEAAYSKHRRQDVLPIHPQLKAAIQDWVGSLKTTEKLFPGNWADEQYGMGGKMVKRDLQEAGLQYQDDANKKFDFHAIRGQFITSCARSGLHPKRAQQLARHSDINLTMAAYTKLGDDELRDAMGEVTI